MIQIKAFFGDWKEATKEQAKQFVNHLLNGMMALNEQRKIQ